MAKKKLQRVRKTPLDVDGILEQHEEDLRAADRAHAPQYYGGWSQNYDPYGERSSSSATATEIRPAAQREAERYVAGSRPAPQGFKSARERKAAKQRLRISNNKKTSTQKKS